MAMVVITCESCGARFRLDADKLTKSRNKVRCSKCKNVFSVEQPGDDALIHIEISDGENDLFPGDIGGGEGGELPGAPPAARKKKSSLGKILMIILPLLILSGGGIYLGFSGKSGLLGNTATRPASPKEPQQPSVTMLDTVQAYYLENINVGQVLVIEGEVMNESSKPVSFILIEGKLFGSNDKVAQVQRCYSGNSLTRKEIANLKPSEIQDRMMNREGKNMKNVRVPPAGKVPFMLIFHNLPEINSLNNYSVDVISSKFD